MSKIIILSGKKQSGKNMCSNHLLGKLRSSKTTSEKSFAGPLKEFCINVLGLEHKQCYGTDEDKDTLTRWRWADLHPDIQDKYVTESLLNEYMTARQVMQIFGTDIVRNMFNQSTWAFGAIRRAVKDSADIVVFTDGRFPNEIDIGKEHNAIRIRIERTNYKYTDKHTSELALDNYNFKENGCYVVSAPSGQLDSLYKQIDEVMKKEGIYEG